MKAPPGPAEEPVNPYRRELNLRQMDIFEGRFFDCLVSLKVQLDFRQKHIMRVTSTKPKNRVIIYKKNHITTIQQVGATVLNFTLNDGGKMYLKFDDECYRKEVSRRLRILLDP